ncbi:MAG TPA: oligosaccharide flippase family protein, partial [Chitinophagaceae bacterium]
MIAWVKNLFKDSLIYGIGFGVSRFLQVLVLPIIARSLSLSEYGYYSNYVIFYTIAGGVFLLGMDNSVARFFFDSQDKLYHKKVFSIGLFCVLFVSFFVAIIFSFFPSALLKIISVPLAYSGALPFVLFTFPMLVLNNFFLNWFKWRRERFFFLINAIGTVALLLIPLAVIKPVGFLFIFKTIFFSQLIVAIVSIALSIKYIRFFFDRSLFISMLKYGFPWMLVFFLGLSRSYLDRFFLTHYL